MNLGREFPHDQRYIGKPCIHCGSKNTYAEIYPHSIEGSCLSCHKPNPVPDSIVLKWGVGKEVKQCQPTQKNRL